MMNLRTRASKKRNNVKNEKFDIFELPLEIQADILSRLPVKSILECKSISKGYDNFISTPFFTSFYHQNSISTNSFTVFAQIPKDKPSLDLIEVKNQKNIYQDTCIGPRSLSGRNDRYFSAWGNCNGLVCVLKHDNLYVTNPIYQDFIKLPHPIAIKRECCLAYGLGYCQVTNRYKVLRIITTRKKHNRLNEKLVSKAEIFTVGFDESWRTVVAKNVPYNMQRIGDQSANPQTLVVSVGSYLHWIVGPVNLTGGTMGEIKPEKSFICAFDMTHEKVGKFPFPQGIDAEFYDGRNCDLGVLSNKVCMVANIKRVINIWVMDEYGVAGSWRKHFMLPSRCYSHPKSLPLSVGRVLISDGQKLVFYDMEAKKSLMDADLMEEMDYVCLPTIFAFDLSFVSLRNMITSGAIQCPNVPVVSPPQSLRYTRTKYKYIPFRYIVPGRRNN